MLAGVSIVASSATSQAGYVYVDSWDFATLGGGNYNASNPFWWGNNPAVYNGVEAAAVLFGGSASDYAISTIDSDPANINHMAFVDGWGDAQYLITPVSELFKFDIGNPGYNDPQGFGTAYSALVFDHGPNYPNAVNYAFRWVDDSSARVPDGGSTAILLGAPLFGLFAAGRLGTKRKRN